VENVNGHITFYCSRRELTHEVGKNKKEGKQEENEALFSPNVEVHAQGVLDSSALIQESHKVQKRWQEQPGVIMCSVLKGNESRRP